MTDTPKDSDQDTDPKHDGPKSAWQTFTEEIEVTGHQLLEEINKLITEGNVRRLLVRSEKGDVYLSVPLTAGAVAGGVVAIAAPWLAVLGAIAGLAAKLKIEVQRDVEAPAETPEATDPDSSGSTDN